MVGSRPATTGGATRFKWRRKLYEGSLRFYVGLILLFLYVPVATVVIYSFNGSDIVFIWRGASFRWYLEALADVGFREGIRNSFIVGLLSASLSVTLGTLLAIGLSVASWWIRGIVGAVMVVVLVTPEVILGLSALLFYTTLDVSLGLPTVVLTHTVLGLSIVALLVAARIARVGRTLEEASADLGAGPWRTLTRVTLPLLSPAVVAGGLLAFTFSFDDFVIAFFTTGPGAQTLPLRIWGQIRFGVTPVANAISTFIVLFSILVTLLAVWAYRRRARRFARAPRESLELANEITR